MLRETSSLTSIYYKYVFRKNKGAEKDSSSVTFFLRQVKKKIKITCHLVREGMLFRKQHTTNEIEISKLAS